MQRNILFHRIKGNRNIINNIDLDQFRPSLKCDLFIPSYIHSLSIATEFIYGYVLSRFPQNFFKTIRIADKHPFEDLRKIKKEDLVKLENPAVLLSYSMQYDYNDNLNDFNLLSINKYLKYSQLQRSFFKYPSKSLYIGMDLEAMMIDYTFKFMVNTRAQQIDLFNRMRKVFRVGCTETVDIDCDFQMDKLLMACVAKESGYSVDTSTNNVIDSWNFTRFLNEHSQMPILYKLRFINQQYEYFLRMRNLPVHLDFQNSLSVDDGNQVGMTSNNYTIEFQIGVRFPAPRTFALYNEGHWVHKIETEKNPGIYLFTLNIHDIPEENYKGWPMYGRSNYVPEEDEKVVESIDIRQLFRAPVDVKVGTDLDAIIQNAIDQYIDPSVFIEIAVYKESTYINNGRIPITIDWPKRTIILPKDTWSRYFYLIIYIDREYVNSKVIEMTKADTNRVAISRISSNKENLIRQNYEQNHLIEQMKFNGNP